MLPSVRVRDPAPRKSAKRNIIRASTTRAAATRRIQCRQQASNRHGGANLEKEKRLEASLHHEFRRCFAPGNDCAGRAGRRALPVPPPWWPATKQNILPVVKEWYSDLPWHQKLGTYAGNQIDEPIIMPYGALPQADIDFCNSHGLTNPADCMIEVGVTNILGMQRIDTPYSTTAPAIMDAPSARARCPASR
jgi:hypothetical protein